MSNEVPEKPATDKAEKTLQFLITCIGHSTSGKIDWNALIEEQNICSVNAAKKRFKRQITEPYNIAENSLSVFGPKRGKKTGDVAAATGKSPVKPRGSSAKKRKVMDEDDNENSNGAGEGEGEGGVEVGRG